MAGDRGRGADDSTASVTLSARAAPGRRRPRQAALAASSPPSAVASPWPRWATAWASGSCRQPGGEGTHRAGLVDLSDARRRAARRLGPRARAHREPGDRPEPESRSRRARLRRAHRASTSSLHDVARAPPPRTSPAARDRAGRVRRRLRPERPAAVESASRSTDERAVTRRLHRFDDGALGIDIPCLPPLSAAVPSSDAGGGPTSKPDDDADRDPFAEVRPTTLAHGRARSSVRQRRRRGRPQLSNLSPAAARAVAAAAKATTDEEREAALAAVAEEGDEPIDRELLLRFLASVKSLTRSLLGSSSPWTPPSSSETAVLGVLVAAPCASCSWWSACRAMATRRATSARRTPTDPAVGPASGRARLSHGPASLVVGSSPRPVRADVGAILDSLVSSPTSCSRVLVVSRDRPRALPHPRPDRVPVAGHVGRPDRVSSR